MGLFASASSQLPQGVTVRNGTIAGFSGDCVRLRRYASVWDLRVESCGRRGISVGDESLVQGNRVRRTGNEGILLGPDSAHANNVVTNSGLAAPARPISGGRAGGVRRFYLTTATYDGANADDAGNCSAGFHFASLWEIHGVSGLRYDTSRGATANDWGEGPPIGSGWVRSGGSSVDPPCNVGAVPWATTVGIGSTASFRTFRSHGRIKRRTRCRPGHSPRHSCVSLMPVWCVED